MKIEIDTQRDSKEELKKLAAFLHHLSDGSAIVTNAGNIFEQGSNDSGGGLLGLFGNDDAPPTSPTTTTSKETTTEELKKDDTKVEFY